MSTKQKLVARIDAFLLLHEMPATTFGRLVCNDNSLVAELRGKRQVSIELYDRINAFIDGYRPTKGRKSTDCRQVA